MMSATQDPKMTRVGHLSVQSLTIITIFLVLLCAETGTPLNLRHKRHLMQLCKTMEEHTAQRSCLDFNGYGCYCGKGSRGSVPVDCVDRCCQAHDNCYDQHQSLLCYPHFVHYSSSCFNGTCQCTDSASKSPCAHGTCECDVVFARCIADCPYNEKYSKMSKEECQKLEEITRTSDNNTAGTSNETSTLSTSNDGITADVPRDGTPGLDTSTGPFSENTSKGSLGDSSLANTPEDSIGDRTSESGKPKKISDNSKSGNAHQ